MRIEDNEFILRCACHDPTCIVHFSVWRERGITGKFNDLDIGLQVDNELSFWQRFCSIFNLLFRPSKFWAGGYICVCLQNPDDRKEVQGLIAFLERCLDETPSEDEEE